MKGKEKEREAKRQGMNEKEQGERGMTKRKRIRRMEIAFPYFHFTNGFFFTSNLGGQSPSGLAASRGSISIG